MPESHNPKPLTLFKAARTCHLPTFTFYKPFRPLAPIVRALLAIKNIVIIAIWMVPLGAKPLRSKMQATQPSMRARHQPLKKTNPCPISTHPKY